jgi:hypothetical protein
MEAAAAAARRAAKQKARADTDVISNLHPTATTELIGGEKPLPTFRKCLVTE